MAANSAVTITGEMQRSNDGRKRQEQANQSEGKRKNQQSKTRHVGNKEARHRQGQALRSFHVCKHEPNRGPAVGRKPCHTARPALRDGTGALRSISRTALKSVLYSVHNPSAASPFHVQRVALCWL